MKRTHKRLTRLLSAGLSLALLTTLLPGAVAASRYTMDGYEVDSDQDLEIYADDFQDFFEDCAEYPNDEISTIYFEDLPSSSEGDLYYYDGSKRYEVDEEIEWRDFDSLLFVPDEDYNDTISLNFRLNTDWETVRGTLKIEVYADSSSSSSDDLEYEIDSDEVLDLNYRDFNAYFDESVEAIEFTRLPDSDDGTLYFDYDTNSEDKVEEDEVYNSNYINDMTFVPTRNFKGTVTIKFDAALDGFSKPQSGTLTITVGEGKSSSSGRTGDVTVYTDVDEEVYFDDILDDFDDYVYETTDEGEEVSRLSFTSLPDEDEGVLWYEDIDDDREVDEDERFQRSDIDYIYFVPEDDFKGSVTIPFEGRSDSGEDFDGDLVINVGVSGDAEVVVKLQGATGNPITFDADDFNDAVVEETGSNLNYVVFDYTSGRGGYLYFDYGGGSEDEVDDARYYRSSSPSLDDVTFVPGSAAGTTTRIPFRGYTTNNKTVSGEVEITYVTLSSPSVITYTSNGLGVDFRASDFSAACAARGGSSLVSVTFPNPSLTGGQLYYSFTSPTKYRGEVISSVTYDVNGIYRLDGITFLPKAEYTGSVVIPYVGTDAAGITYNGNIQIMVTPPSTTTRFNDMGSYGWAVPGVEFLAAYGITTGTGTGTTYSPAGTLTRGDYILMLVRTFGFTADGAASGNFSDVKADAYYADALAVARALGIATADANGNFRPGDPVTRQDSMVFLYRAMQKANRTIPSAYDSYLTRFPDGASVATDARPAMAAMAQAGVIKGDQAGNLNPTGTLTRAEMAVILHRALTL